jgi:methyl-accepting chemotaxis protein
MGPVSLKIAGYLLFYELVLLVPILAVVGVIFSHRVAGPLVNIERTLRAIGDGDLSRRVVLREKDELRALEMSVNEMAAGLSDKLLEIEKAITVLQEKLLSLTQETGKELPNINRVREEIKSLASSLDMLKNQLDKFKR